MSNYDKDLFSFQVIANVKTGKTKRKQQTEIYANESTICFTQLVKQNVKYYEIPILKFLAMCYPYVLSCLLVKETSSPFYTPKLLFFF